MGLFAAKKNREADLGRELFEDARKNAPGNVQALLRTSDLYPVYLSSNFYATFGVEPERVADDVETLLRFVPEESWALYKKKLREWDRITPLSFVVDYQRPHAACGQQHFRLSLAPALSGEYILVEMVDISAEADSGEALRAQRDSALAVAENRIDFLNQMSHEVRTPLNGINGMIALARDHMGDTERLARDLDRAEELSGYLLTLVNDMLDMGRLSNGRVELESLPFDMRLVAAEIRAMFEDQAAEKGISYSVEIDDCEHAYLLGDRMRLNRVIVNFVSNALKFTDAGGSVEVCFREMYATDERANYMIRVRDTGKGMDPRFVDRIFRPFEQEDRTIARRYGGTGLGMPIANALVELMGGEIVVDTELGRGTDFTAYIPFNIANESHVASLESCGETLETKCPDSSDSAEYDFNGRHFLMAEDNEVNAMIATEVFEKLGARVDVANDGPVVVSMFEGSSPGEYDAVLMDIQMPTFNGWEAAKRIRSLERPDAKIVPIIALSANNYTEDARASIAAGMNGHVGKPLDYLELQAQLAAAVAKSTIEGALS